MTEPKKPDPDDEDLLEFLGGIDEVNDESQGDDLTGFLAKTDIDRLAAKQPANKAPPPKDEKNE